MSKHYGLNFKIGARKWNLVLFTITIFVYAQGLSGKFVWDDRTYFIDNDILTNLKPWDLKVIFSQTTNYWGEHLPIRDFLYVCQYYLFGQSPYGYHIVSLFLYIMIGYILYKLLVELYSNLSPPELGNKNINTADISALAVTAFFLAHPTHVESVAYISGQKDLLCALFSFLTIYLFYTSCRHDNITQVRKLIPIIICYYLSFLSKSTAISNAIFIPLLWFFVFRKNNKKNLTIFIGWSLINIPVLIWMVYSINLLDKYWGTVTAIPLLPLTDRIIRAVKIVGAHTTLAFKPFPLNFGYPFNYSRGFDVDFFVGISMLTLIFFLLFLRRKTIASVGCVIFILYLLPVMQISFESNDATVYDRFLFIPILGVGLVLERLCRFLNIKWNKLRTAVAALTLIVVTGLFSMTYYYVPKFNSDVISTRNAYNFFPDWPSSAFSYVYSLIESGELDEAMKITVKEKTFSKPPWVRGYFIGWILLERGETEMASQLLRESSILSMVGGYFPFPNVPLGKALIKLGKHDEASNVLEYVILSEIKNPLEMYKAKKLLEQIHAK